MKNQHETPEALAHTLFTAAQLAPGEGIEDAVGRLAAQLEAHQHARIAELEAQLESIGAGGVSGPLIGQPQAMPDLSQLTERGAKAWAGVDAQGLREGFTAADMATVSAQGFRDGWTAAQAISAEPAGATEMENLQRTAVGWQERALRAERNWVVCRSWAIAGGAPVEKLGDDPDQPFHAASPAIEGESNV